MTEARHDPGSGLKGRLREIVFVFLKLGTLGFGGPAAHVALLEDEVVRRRRWLERGQFLDLMGATQLIPGPNSTEMAIGVGFLRAGWAGLFAAGACFILPAALISTVLAWAYRRWGALPEVERFVWGVQPVVLAVIAGAILRLGRSALGDWRVVPIAALAAAASTLGVGELEVLLGGGLLGTLWLLRVSRRPPAAAAAVVPLAAPLPLAALGAGAPAASALATALAPSAAPSLAALGLFFLKVGAVLYGSGYVLVAFLEAGLVAERSWLTSRELVEAVAVGQVTPGPLLSTATFAGYLVLGLPGAAVATAAIFLPAFVFTAAVVPLVPRLRRWRWTGAFLDAVNAASIALMAVVTVRLGARCLVSWPAWALCGLGGCLLVMRVNPAWIVLGGALAGGVLHGLR